MYIIVWLETITFKNKIYISSHNYKVAQNNKNWVFAIITLFSSCIIDFYTYWLTYVSYCSDILTAMFSLNL